MDTITELARKNEAAFMDAAIEAWGADAPEWAQPYLRKAEDLYQAELAMANWSPAEAD